MSALDDLMTEILALRSTAAQKQATCGCSSADSDAAAATITLKRGAHFPSPDGSHVELKAGEYYVSVLPDRSMLISSQTERRHWNISATRTWHEFNLTSPLALGVLQEQTQLVVALFPGGVAFVSGGARKVSAKVPKPKLPPPQLIVEAIQEWLTWPPLRPQSKLPFEKEVLLGGYHALRFGEIQAVPTPTRFAPMSTPPNWIGAIAVTCAAAGYPYIPCPYTPGDSEPRGAFPHYVTATVGVTASAVPTIQAGNVVQLLVTSLVMDVSVGNTESMVSTWTDTYQIVATASGPVTFPGVILATGRDSSSSAGVWVSDADAAFTSHDGPGTGTPVHFELRINGITIVTRDCKYNANENPKSPGGPLLTCS
ncbi:MAG TPA: hypothetical protein VE779_12420 [Candidatus Angelobacter sp.]|nr:hypothetical protein [Candidatus Angelobacter sp.]